MRYYMLCAAIWLQACDVAAPQRVQAPADSASGEVAFSLTGPNEAAFVVPVRINGRAPVNFIVDTGATLTCIDVSLARVLGLREGERSSGVAIGAMSTGRVETVMIDTLRVGNAAAFDIMACRLDMAALREALDVQGLVGLNFLKQFDVAIDFDRHVLRLTDRAD
jgi:clan AA aspartic protease (TIGR02281 family)